MIDIERLNQAMDKLKVLNHPHRIAMIELMSDNGKMSVSEIQRNLNLEQGGTSNHLRLLKAQKIVFSTWEGKIKYYSVRKDILSAIINSIDNC